ncbi:hypothetical protein D2V08_06420 [Flagellimonas lutimaris]|uniref:EpsG family protein n=2 Tax=Flagellimonas lutimaris TaxID=475082 RepID=A0A3A1NAK3_9FLAO|nr:hypothetical protein D2V08_06420 [Allomuricauda lutimaris]
MEGYFSFGKKKVSSFLVILISTFLGFLNTTKKYESDLLTYFNEFQLAADLSFFEYLSSFGKDPIFYGAMYFFHWVGNFQIFIFFFTFLSYYFFLKAIRLFYQKTANDKEVFFAILFATLFFEIFSLSAHLVRQFLAFSILLYYLVNKVILEKNKWGYLIVAVFTHTTMLFFLPLIFFPAVGKKINIQRGLAIIIVLAIVIRTYQDLAIWYLQTTSSSNILTYLMERLSQKSISDGIDVPKVLIGFNILVLVLALLMNYVIKKKDLYHFNNCIIFVTLLVLLTAESHPLLSYRYGYLAYTFSAFLVPFFTSRKFVGSMISIIIKSLVTLVLLVNFVVKLENGVWEYIPMDKLIFKTTLNYFF